MIKKHTFIVFLMIIGLFTITLVGCGDKTVDQLESEYGIVVEGGEFEEGSKLVSNLVDLNTNEGQNVINSLVGKEYNKSGNIYIYDIYVLKDDKLVQPNGKIEVTIPIPNNLIKEYIIFHIKDNGEIHEISPKVENNNLVIEVDSFSYFVVADKAHSHSFNSVVTNPTCTEKGYTTHTCTCGESYIDQYVDEIGHTYDNGIVIKEPTHFEEGVRKFTCSVCGDSKEEPIEKNGHQYELVQGSEPTCIEEGIVKHYHCEECGKNFDMNYGEITDITIDKLNHEYGDMYYAYEPTFFAEGNIAYYYCEKCENYFDEEYKQVETVSIPKLSSNLSVCINGVATPLEKIEENDSHIIWNLDGLSVTKGDLITLCETNNTSVVYNYFSSGNVDKDGKIITTAQNVSLVAEATPNGIMLFIEGYKYEGIVIEINGEQYPMYYVTYTDGTPTYIYGYVYLEADDEFVIVDNINNITYDYDDLDESDKWNIWDFHRGDNGQFVMDYSARYGIEFYVNEGNTILIDKVFAPLDGSSYDIVFEDETKESSSLSEILISENDEAYLELLWFINNEKVMNNQDIVNYINQHGLYFYSETVYFEAGDKFNIQNNTVDSIINSEHLIDVYTYTNSFTINGDYIEILIDGYYMISYMPCFNGFMFSDSYVETADIFMYFDGEFIPLDVDDNNVATYKGLTVEANSNIAFVSNNYSEFYPILLDSNVTSAIAQVIEANGMSMVMFNKAGTYDLSYNIETGILSIVDLNSEEPDDNPVEYMYFLSVVDSTNGNQTLYFTRTPNEDKEVIITGANLFENCFIAVGGVAVGGSSSTENYGALSGTDSSIAQSYGTIILIKKSGLFDVYFNIETKTVRLVLEEQPEHTECTYDEGVVTKEATHTEYGIRTFTCIVCGETKEERIEKVPGHSFGNWLPDEENPDKHYRECLCGEVETADCTYDEGVVTKEATHTEYGIRTFTCSVCGGTKEERIEKLSGHSFGNWLPDEENPDKHYRECLCGEVETADCTYDEGVVTKEATHTEYGIRTFTCSVCGGTKEERIEKVPGHSFGNWLPDEVELEKHYKQCLCGEVETADCTFVETTDEESGLIVLACTECGRKKEADQGIIIVVYNGSASVVGKETTTLNTELYGENANVYIAQENDVLNVSLTEQEGRIFKYWVSATGTIIPDEEFSILVFVNGYYYPVFEDTDINGFSNREKIFEGNCEEGTLFMSTNSLGDVKYEVEFEHGGYHDFGEYENFNNKYHKQVCLICGETIFENHIEYDRVIVKEAGHAEEGQMKYECSCGHEWLESIPVTEEHTVDYDEWEIVEESINGEYGKYRVYCKYCDYYEEYWYLENTSLITFMEGKMINYQYTYGGKVCHDEYYYSYVNEEGEKVYIWAIQYESENSSNRDYNDTYIFMYIDDEDSETLEPIYLSKSKGDRRSEYLWAIYGYAYDINDWIKIIDSPDYNIGCGHGMSLSNSMSARSSVFESYHDYWAKTYNELRIPTSKEYNDFSDTSWAIYHEGKAFQGGYTDENGEYVTTGGRDIISYVKNQGTSYTKYMHVDKATGITYGYEDYGTYYRTIFIMRQCKEIVSPEEFTSLDVAGQSLVYSYGDIETDIKSLCSKRTSFSNFTLTIPETANAFRLLFSNASGYVDLSGSDVNVYNNSAYVYNSGSPITFTWEGAEGIAFDRYEIWDFENQEWITLSESSTYVFNSSSDPRRDAAYVRVVYHEITVPVEPSEMYRITVENGYFEIDGIQYEGTIEVASGTMVYIYANRVEYKTFDHWLDGNGEEFNEYSFTVTSDMIFTPVYIDTIYTIYCGGWNYDSYVSIDGGEMHYTNEIEGKLGDTFELNTTYNPEYGCTVFIGWYMETYGSYGYEYVLISDSETFTYEIEGDVSGTLYAVWTTGENPFIKKYVEIRSENGFVLYSGGEAGRVLDNAYNVISVSYMGRLQVFDNPTDENNYTFFEMTYRYELEGELISDIRESFISEDEYYPADFWIDDPQYSYPDGVINVNGIDNPYDTPEEGIEEGIVG